MSATTRTPSASGPLPDTMRASRQHRYGPGSVLEVAERPIPTLGKREVLVRVRAAGVSRGAWHLMVGRPYLMRLGTGLRSPRQPVPGHEVSGEVVALGPDASGVGVGDEVFGFGRGTFAEYALVKADKLAPKPPMLDCVEAAAIVDSGTTALQAVVDQGQVAPGHRVLVVGASGGVGIHAVQIAAGLGAEVTGVCSRSKVDAVRQAGAHHVVDYTIDDLGDPGIRYDVILDVGGNRPVRQLRRLLTPRGTLVLVGGERGGAWFGGIGRQVRGVLRALFSRQRVRMFVAVVNRRQLDAVAEQVANRVLRPVVDRTFPLDQAGEAMDHLESGRAVGKVVVVP